MYAWRSIFGMRHTRWPECQRVLVGEGLVQLARGCILRPRSRRCIHDDRYLVCASKDDQRYRILCPRFETHPTYKAHTIHFLVYSPVYQQMIIHHHPVRNDWIEWRWQSPVKAPHYYVFDKKKKIYWKNITSLYDLLRNAVAQSARTSVSVCVNQWALIRKCWK